MGRLLQAYLEWVVKHPLLVLCIVFGITVSLALPIRNLTVIIDPNKTLPQEHPYVVTTNTVEDLFASKNILFIGLVPKAGDLLTSQALVAIDDLTRRLQGVEGVRSSKVLSLRSRQAKVIEGMQDGFHVRPIVDAVPQSPEEKSRLMKAIEESPMFDGMIVSGDRRMAAIVVELTTPRNGYRPVVANVSDTAQTVADTFTVELGGWPIYAAQLEKYSDRVALIFPFAVLVIGLIHFEAFRTIQGLVLPLVTALAAVIWALGIMAYAHVPLDGFNSSTPILILAVAAGHAVQILKRYYEEYQAPSHATPRARQEANVQAVVSSLMHVGPVMIAAGCAAALAFFSLIVFKMTVIKTFGIFTGLGILSALIIELSLIPALRSILPAPKRTERRDSITLWDKLAGATARLVTKNNATAVAAITGILVLAAFAIPRVTIDDSIKSYFDPHLPFQLDDRRLNDQLAGTETVYVLIEGQEDALKRPDVLKAIEALQRHVKTFPFVGKAVSIADFVKRMNKAMNGDAADQDRIPDDQNLIAQYLLLYSFSGEPGDFDSYVNYPYSKANVWVLLKTDSTAHVRRLVDDVQAYIAAHFPEDVHVTLGGSAVVTLALADSIIYGKLRNVVQISIAILIIAALVFRSLVAGLLVLVPLLLTVVINFTIMGLLGIPLNTATAIISVMAIGLGADYAIYLLFRLREELAKGRQWDQAIAVSLATAGKAIMYVATAISGGYILLIFSWGFYVHLWFGLLTTSSMAVSAAASLVILPSLLSMFRPAFLFERHAKALPLDGAERLKEA